MPRPRSCCKVAGRPKATEFLPREADPSVLDRIWVSMAELEAIRLADRDGLYQEEASKLMGVSRATFGRLLQSARHKIAAALLEGQALVFETPEAEPCAGTCGCPRAEPPQACGCACARSQAEPAPGAAAPKFDRENPGSEA